MFFSRPAAVKSTDDQTYPWDKPVTVNYQEKYLQALRNNFFDLKLPKGKYFNEESRDHDFIKYNRDQRSCIIEAAKEGASFSQLMYAMEYNDETIKSTNPRHLIETVIKDYDQKGFEETSGYKPMMRIKSEIVEWDARIQNKVAEMKAATAKQQQEAAQKQTLETIRTAQREYNAFIEWNLSFSEAKRIEKEKIVFNALDTYIEQGGTLSDEAINSPETNPTVSIGTLLHYGLKRGLFGQSTTPNVKAVETPALEDTMLKALNEIDFFAGPSVNRMI